MLTFRPVVAGIVTAALVLPLPAFADATADVPAPAPIRVEQPETAENPPAEGSWAWGILLPGLGQIAVGEPVRGVATLGATVALPPMGLATGTVAGGLVGALNGIGRPGPDPQMGWGVVTGMASGGIVGLAAGTLAAAAVWAWGAMDAYATEQAKRAKVGYLPSPAP